MQYQGGKCRLANGIVAKLPEGKVADVFAGGLSISAKLGGSRLSVINDGNVALINMYRAWRRGWRPRRIDLDEYNELKRLNDANDPMTAFAGFGLSYAGKWFGGYARNIRGDDYHGAAVRSITRKMRAIGRTRLESQDYRSLDLGSAEVVYLDPPYRNTTGYKTMGEFDSNSFWAWAESLSQRTFVSEYAAPDGWIEISRFEHKGKNLAQAGLIDKLFTKEN